jgi:hypothetical protein
MIISTPIDNRQAVIDWFLENVGSFIVRSTNYSAMVKSENHRVQLTDSAIGYNILGMISKVKADCRKVLPSLPISDVHSRPTHNMKPVEDMEGVTIYEYDKNAAYANAALVSSIISEETFQKIMRIDKRFRLSILGSLASRPTIETYQHAKRISITTTENPLRPAWDFICNTVAGEMNLHFICNPSIFAYWVDAIYSFQPIDYLKGYKSKVFIADIKTDVGLRIIRKGEQYLFIPYPAHLRTNPRTRIENIPMEARP